jgi:hypothetical protein
VSSACFDHPLVNTKMMVTHIYMLIRLFFHTTPCRVMSLARRCPSVHSTHPFA